MTEGYQYKKCDICGMKNAPYAENCKKCNSSLDNTPVQTGKDNIFFRILLLFFVFVIFVFPFFKYTSNKQNKISDNTRPIWGSYMVDLEKNVKQNWHPPRQANSKKVVVYFVIDRKGNLVKMSIKESSGNKQVDDSARWAILKTKFKPLPREYKGKSVPIEFTFDYNIVNKRM